MLTEVDTREVSGQSVALFMDTDTQVYLVCVEGFAPITCLTRERAVNAYRHPYAYLPLEGAVSPSNGTEAASPSQTATVPSGEDLGPRTSAVLIELKQLLQAMSDSDFHWTVGVIADMMRSLEDHSKPYDQDEELPF